MVLIKPIRKKTTLGGIIIPDTAKDQPTEGKVISVGKGKQLENGRIQDLEVEVGDTVLFREYSGIKYSDDLLLVGAENLLAILYQD